MPTLEFTSAAGIRGIGRVGADFWNVLATRNKTYGGGLNLIARYPESDWNQLNLNAATEALLAPGPDGAVTTERFEAIREGMQECETRIFIEKALASRRKGPVSSASLR